jgi:methionyl-tRNA formyltransferase
MTRAVVFAYHNVGVRCLKALLGRGVEVALVVTHQDSPGENIWFDSVEKLAREYNLPCITPEDPNSEDVVAMVAALQPDFLFSFYYRKMLRAELLACPTRGAFNMHGSLLPKYRGRVPINWAVLHGESETGATLHVMNIKPDNGAIVDQFSVPILPDDTAGEVFAKVVVASEAGSAHRVPQDLSQGGYFGGRKPEDGRIDPCLPAETLHNFIRALSQPYPGGFADTAWGRLTLWKSRVLAPPGHSTPGTAAYLSLLGGALCLTAIDGGVLVILDAELDGQPLNASTFAARFGERASLLLSNQPA